MRQEISDRINGLMMEYQGKLNASTLLVQEACTEEEFQRYRRAVGRATDFMFIEITRALEGASGPESRVTEGSSPPPASSYERRAP